MKTNVDLTEDLVFQKNKLRTSRLKNKDVPVQMQNKVFLDIDNCINIDTEREKNAVTQGNKYRRQFYKEISVGFICCRCGKNLSYLPWLDRYGLCPECQRALNLQERGDFFERTY